MVWGENRVYSCGLGAPSFVGESTGVVEASAGAVEASAGAVGASAGAVEASALGESSGVLGFVLLFVLGERSMVMKFPSMDASLSMPKLFVSMSRMF